MKKLELTKSQNEFLEDFNNFIKSDEKVFILTGNAGTGKTFLIKVITELLNKKNISFKLMSPTGRAAKIINEKTKLKAYTIHKTIYSFEKINYNKNSNSTVHYSYKLRQNSDKKNTVYIVDESSMISDKDSVSELIQFGTGNLMRDLFKYVNFDDLFSSRKILFIGDPFQLPPVNSKLSPALNNEILYDKYNINSENSELNEVVRHQLGSDIIKIANDVREYQEFNPSNYCNLNDVKIINDRQEFVETYFDVCGHEIDNKTIIITYTNKLAFYYNRFVRNYFFEDQSELIPGDRVLITHNNYNHAIELLNGDFGEVIDVSSETDTLIQKVSLFSKNKRTNGNKNIELKFKEAIIKFDDANNNPHFINCNILTNLLYSSERDLSSTDSKALFVNFQERNSDLQINSEEYTEKFKFDKYLNSLRIKFGYSVTCHKAQGGEWDNVFVDISQIYASSEEELNRWLYTAFTRAKQKLFIYSPSND